MKTLAICFFICLIYRFLTNVTSYFRTKYYERKYIAYLSRKFNNFEEYTPPVVKLFKEADIKDLAIRTSGSIGYGYIKVGSVSMFQNLSALRNDVIIAVQHSFKVAIGTYKMRIVECFSPLFWVKFALYLPSRILGYIGLDEKSTFTKIIQVAYWVLTPLLIVCRTELYDLIIQFLIQAQ